MPRITNVYLEGLERSIYRSGYPMMTSPPTEDEFTLEVAIIIEAILEGDYSNNHIKRAISLANSRGGGHDQFLTGIIVDFDLTISNKAWVDSNRYKFLNFVSSMSTMHRIAKLDGGDLCNEYVEESAIERMRQLQKEYNEIDASKDLEGKKKAYLKILYNTPPGLELTAGMQTNYRCLKNIYEQRRTHRLPDFQMLCDWIETLPLSAELITGKNGGTK